MQGIADQIAQHALERNPAQRERWDRLQAQPHPFFRLVVRRHHFAHQVGQVDLLNRLVTAIADKGQELVEDRVHVLDIADHVVTQFAVAVQQ
ncbi:hypothetical protein D3C75_844230 [compost metagenome]